MKMNRTIYEPPPPPPKPGDFPKKPPFWNLTGTSIQKEFNKGCVKVVLGLALFAGIIMYYGDSKMNRFYKHMSMIMIREMSITVITNSVFMFLFILLQLEVLD